MPKRVGFCLLYISICITIGPKLLTNGPIVIVLNICDVFTNMEKKRYVSYF